MKLTKYIAASLLVMGFGSCSSDYLDTEYTAALDSEQAGEAAGRNPGAFLNGIWGYMAGHSWSNHEAFNYMAAIHALDMMGEDIAMGGEHWFIYDHRFEYRGYEYARTAWTWTTFYTMIARANEIIDMYPNGAEGDGEKALLGQALAVRGFALTDLIQIYQDLVKEDGSLDLEAKGVPLKLVSADEPDAEVRKSLQGRNTVARVFEQIESDLTRAATMLEEANYTRPNKDFIDANVANGLLARYYLVSRKWDKAAEAAHKAREGYVPMSEEELHDGFLDIENKEWMWGFDETSETSTVYASFFSHISNLAPGYAGLGYAPRLIDRQLYEQIPADDYRKGLFNGPAGDNTQSQTGAKAPYANVKFGDDGNWTMDYMYMRAAEMYLIEAEALARQDKGSEAAQVLGLLMAKRQPSWNETSVTVDDVLLQRRIELWGEGFRYFDLRRDGKGINRNYLGSNHLASAKMEVPAHDVLWLYQIPRSEMQENDQLTADDQNP